MTYVPTLPLGDDTTPPGGPAPAVRTLAATAGVRVLDYCCSAEACSGWVGSRHAATSLVLVTEGAYCYADHGYTRLLEPGSLVVGLVGDSYACAHDYGGGDKAVVVQFAPGALEAELGEKRFKAGMVLAPDPRLAALARRAATGGAEALESTAYELAGLATGDRAEVPPSLRVGDRDRAHRAAGYLETNAGRAIALTELAEAVGASPFHLARTFRQELGLSPYQYLMRVRLRRAAELLVDTAMPVTEVAYAVGFGDLSNFHRAFKRAMGQTPERFRRA